jgi:uncharacterized protein
MKVHGRCNLACDYCYVYEHVDQSWRDRPRAMSPAVTAAAARRIGAYVRAHALSVIEVILHGGEPLLAGPAAIAALIDRLRAQLPAGCRLDLAVQTNATLLDDRFRSVFHRYGVRVGVSVDGGRVANDRHRRFPDGRGSFAQVRPVLDALAAEPGIYAGILCTVDLANDPVHTYERLLAFAPPRLDFLLPHGNWVHPPPGRPPEPGVAPYGEWLVTAFDRWYDAPRRETEVRLFDSIVALVLGGRSASEAVGLALPDLITIQTDGSIAAHDALLTTASGMAATGLTVFTNTLDEAAAHPRVRIGSTLGATCRACPVVRVCGGGLPAHRFRGRDDFTGPSVYCADLFRLVTHVEARVRADVRRRLRQRRPAGT